MKRSEVRQGGVYAVVEAWQRLPAADRPATPYVVTDVSRSPSAPMAVVGHPVQGGERRMVDLRTIVAPWDTWERLEVQRADEATEATRLRQEAVAARQGLVEALQAVGVPAARLDDFVAGGTDLVVLTETEIRAILGSRLAE